MILLIDIGNTRTKYVQVNNDKLTETVQLSNEGLTQGYFSQNFSDASQIILANVAKGELTQNIETWCSVNSIDFLQVHSEKHKAGLTSAYQEPTSLGIDRWLALLGAINLYPKQNILIIDAGTATTVDLVDATGQHQGGWILAGIQALFNSIISHSTLVHAEQKFDANIVFGLNTTDNVNNACWAATLGMIEQGIYQAEQTGQIDRILLTGGNGNILTKLLTEQSDKTTIEKHKITAIDNLVFYGLKAYVN